jgi:hypothetical protein
VTNKEDEEAARYREMANLMLSAANLLWAVKEKKVPVNDDSLIETNQEIYAYLKKHGYPENSG